MPLAPTTVVAINGYNIPDVVKGTYSIDEGVAYTEYKAEDGTSTIEVIQNAMYQGTVTFKALLQSDIQAIANALTPVSGIEMYLPYTGDYVRFTALIDGKTSVYKRRERLSPTMNVWSLSFGFRQISPLGEVPVPPESEGGDELGGDEGVTPDV